MPIPFDIFDETDDTPVDTGPQQGVAWIDPDTLNPITAFGGTGVTIEQLAAAVVPAGVSYEIIDETTVDQWRQDHEQQETLYNQERAVVEQKYSAPWNGSGGGILTALQMTMTSALCEVPQDPTKLTNLGNQYQTELANMNAEFSAIDAKYGVS